MRMSGVPFLQLPEALEVVHATRDTQSAKYINVVTHQTPIIHC